MEAINLDILPGAMPPIVHVSQGDVGRQFQIAIYDETGSAYSLTGKTLSIVGHKGDGNVFQYAIPSSAVSGNTVTITTEEQMTPAAGKALCEIRIEQNGTKIGTCNFVMQVEQGPADLGSLSTSALYIIDALMQEARDASAEAEAAAETAEAAISTVTQKATEAAASATAAATSASNAANSATNAASSASAAASSASQAASVVEGVHDDAVAAANSATAADLSATAAATSASTASTAASNASTYATAADSSADAASGYADAASQSATAAATSASNASGSASDASTAATNAANSATAASGSASDASTYASNASSSATAAAGSASDASTYAGNAATSATNAANSATAAASSASDAAAAESKIENMTVSSQSVPSTQSADVVKTEVGGVYNLDFKIPRGADGADGEGFKVKAQYATYADMIAAHPTGQVGDAYQVGENPAPTINNSTITLTQGGVTKGSFTLNQASSATIDLDAGGGNGDDFTYSYVGICKDSLSQVANISSISIYVSIMLQNYVDYGGGYKQWENDWNTIVEVNQSYNDKAAVLAALGQNLTTWPAPQPTNPNATEARWILREAIVTFGYDNDTAIGYNDPTHLVKDSTIIPIVDNMIPNKIPYILASKGDYISGLPWTAYKQSSQNRIVIEIGYWEFVLPDEGGIFVPGRYDNIPVICN